MHETSDSLLLTRRRLHFHAISKAWHSQIVPTRNAQTSTSICSLQHSRTLGLDGGFWMIVISPADERHQAAMTSLCPALSCRKARCTIEALSRIWGIPPAVTLRLPSHTAPTLPVSSICGDSSSGCSHTRNRTSLLSRIPSTDRQACHGCGCPDSILRLTMLFSSRDRAASLPSILPADFSNSCFLCCKSLACEHRRCRNYHISFLCCLYWMVNYMVGTDHLPKVLVMPGRSCSSSVLDLREQFLSAQASLMWPSTSKQHSP